MILYPAKALILDFDSTLSNIPHITAITKYINTLFLELEKYIINYNCIQSLSKIIVNSLILYVSSTILQSSSVFPYILSLL